MMTPPSGGPRDDAATIRPMDPHRVLGVSPTATPEEVATTYRRLAKEWHPDRGGGPARMAEINAAYDLLRATAWTRRHAPHPARQRAGAGGRAAWLPPAIRRALGHELLGAIEPDEHIWLVTPTSTWASPQALLAASDHRLLWLLDDAVNGRVQTLRFAAIEAAEHTLRRPRRRVATLRVRALDGRRFAFGELRPATAAVLTSRIARDATARRP
jgi:DnaJ domain